MIKAQITKAALCYLLLKLVFLLLSIWFLFVLYSKKVKVMIIFLGGLYVQLAN